MASSLTVMREQTPVTPGKLEVPAHKLAEELEGIRREAVKLDTQLEAAQRGQAAPRFRATLCNLIMFVSHHGRSVPAGTVDRLITELCVSYPSRFFIVDYSCEGAANECTCDGKVHTAVSSRCVLANSGIHVCSEEVYVGVRPKSLHSVSNLLLSLLVPNVNTVLLMLCDPARKLLGCWHEHAEQRFISLVRGIAADCELIVYDSELFDNYTESMKALLDHNGDGLFPEINLVHRDLNWERTGRWRDLIAEQFDSERLAAAVQDIERIRFSCAPCFNSNEGSRVSPGALLIAGWVCSRLGWTCTSVSRSQLEHGVNVACRAADGSEKILQFIRGQAPGKPPVAFSGLSGVEIVLHAAEQLVRMGIELTGDGDAVEVSLQVSGSAALIGSADRFARRVPFAPPMLEQLVAPNVQSYGTDEQYLDSLQGARALAALLS